MEELVKSFARNETDLEKDKEKLLNRKKEADETKSKIIDELSKSTYPSTSREKIIRLVLTLDDVAANVRAAGAKLTFLKPEKVDEDLQKHLKKLSEYALKAVKLLADSLHTLIHEDVKKAIEKSGQVEKIEENADSFRAQNIVPKIVTWADKSHNPGTAYLFIQVEENIEESIDQAENSTDIIREIAVGVL